MAHSLLTFLIARARSAEIEVTLEIKTEEFVRIHWTKVLVHTLVARERTGVSLIDFRRTVSTLNTLGLL
jgi:hypothetical protein